jgi:hypothetical protein
VVRGHIEVVTDPDEVERIRAVWQPRPWAEGPRDVWVKLPWHELSGRRLGDGWTRDNEMPVRRVVSSL